MTNIPDTIVHRTRNGVQTYSLVAVEHHTGSDGGKTQLAVWRSSCRVCGRAFYVTSGTSERYL
jgi:hypothetical protein